MNTTYSQRLALMKERIFHPTLGTWIEGPRGVLSLRMRGGRHRKRHVSTVVDACVGADGKGSSIRCDLGRQDTMCRGCQNNIRRAGKNRHISADVTG